MTRRSPWPLLAVLLPLGLLLALEVTAAWRHLEASPGDFGNYHRAGQALSQGRSPYEVERFDYPPLVAFLVAPLGGSSPLGAQRAWFAFNLLCLLAAATVVWRTLGGRLPAALAVATVWGLGGTVAENLALGQVNPVLLLLLSLTLACRQKLPMVAGVALGVAIALKLWPAVVAWLFLLQRRWRLLAITTATVAVLVAGPLLFIALRLPPPHLPGRAGYWMGSPAPLNQSLSAVALRLADPPRDGAALPQRWRAGVDPRALRLPPAEATLSVAVAAVTLALGGVAAAWSWRRSGTRRGQEPRLLVFLISLGVLVSPISWYHYHLFHFLPLTILIAGSITARRWGALAAALSTLVVLTRFPQGALGAYVAAYGWTAARPILLWVTTSAAPLLTVVLLAVLVSSWELPWPTLSDRSAEPEGP